MYVVYGETKGRTSEVGRCTTLDEVERLGEEFEKDSNGGFWCYCGEAGPIDNSFPKMEW